VTAIPEGLLQYFAIREQNRAGMVQRTLEALTLRELQLVREAAVMGYVTGVRCGPHRERIPDDSPLVAEVVAACLEMPDLYPLLAAIAGNPTAPPESPR
jgi:hypothetical protein